MNKEDFYERRKVMNKDIKNDLCELISDLRGVKQNINENDSLKKDLGLDSLMLQSIVKGISEKHNKKYKII